MNNKKPILVISIILVIMTLGIVTYLILSSNSVNNSKDDTLAFDRTISNNFITPHISAKILGQVRPSDNIRIDTRGGVDTLSISGDNYMLTIVILGNEYENSTEYQSVVNLKNVKISNMFRTMDPKEYYLDGFEGWHYSNDNENGSSMIKKDGIIFEITCNLHTDSGGLEECDKIMETLEIQ